LAYYNTISSPHNDFFINHLLGARLQKHQLARKYPGMDAASTPWKRTVEAFSSHRLNKNVMPKRADSRFSV